MLCDVKTTDKIKNDCLYRQCPLLASKCKITDKNLSEYQLNQIKNKRNNKNSNFNYDDDYNSILNNMIKYKNLVIKEEII